MKILLKIEKQPIMLIYEKKLRLAYPTKIG